MFVESEQQECPHPMLEDHALFSCNTARSQQTLKQEEDQEGEDNERDAKEEEDNEGEAKEEEDKEETVNKKTQKSSNKSDHW